MSASQGREVSAKLQEEPPSLYVEQEVRQGFPWLFVRPSRFLFARKEGLFCRGPSLLENASFPTIFIVPYGFD